MLTIQRTAGLAARDNTERVRIFSWLGVAPSFSNVIGPVAGRLMIDAAGFRAAYGLLLALPLATLLTARAVPRLRRPATPPDGRAHGLGLLRAPGLKRLLLVVNWLLSMCWDVHTFAVPILGHERNFSASTIGFILGTFTLSVTGPHADPAVGAPPAPGARVAQRDAGHGAGLRAVPAGPQPWLMGPARCCWA
jgi:predicted MFS family arabinose efflux permease